MSSAPASFCNCYVSKLDSETQFCLRYGAHSLSCPVYRKSADPVDNKGDRMYRALNEPLGVTGCGNTVFAHSDGTLGVLS